MRANLSNANFLDADLLLTDFIGASYLNSEKIKAAKNWENAEYDEGFRKELGLLL